MILPDPRSGPMAANPHHISCGVGTPFWFFFLFVGLQQNSAVASFVVWQSTRLPFSTPLRTLSAGFDTAPTHRRAELLVTGRQVWTGPPQWQTGIFATTFFFLLHLSVFHVTHANKGNLAFGLQKWTLKWSFSMIKDVNLPSTPARIKSCALGAASPEGRTQWKAETRHLCLGTTGTPGLQLVRYSQELILPAQVLSCLLYRKAQTSAWWCTASRDEQKLQETSRKSLRKYVPSIARFFT